MTRFTLIAAGLTMFSCGSSDKNGSGDSGGGGGDNSCGVSTVALSYPASDGATDFYYRGAVQFELDGTDSDASISLTNKGNDVAGVTTFNDETSTMSFQPDASLSPSTEYFATLSYCGGDVTVSFNTSSLGADLSEGPDGLIDRTFVVDLATANFVEPVGVGSLIGSFLTQSILLGVVSADDNSMVMRGAISVDGSTAQDYCNPSIEFPEAADFTESPYFQIGPEDTVLSASGFDVNIRRLRISGDFAPDYSYFGGGVLEGEIDARDLVDILVDNDLISEPDPAAVCEMIAPLGVICGECESDGLAYCLTIKVTQIHAREDAGNVLLQVDECDEALCTEQGDTCAEEEVEG
jgi:hypothetical protein